MHSTLCSTRKGEEIDEEKPHARLEQAYDLENNLHTYLYTQESQWLRNVYMYMYMHVDETMHKEHMYCVS